MSDYKEDSDYFADMLADAIEQGDMLKILRLLEEDVDVNAKDKNGKTALDIAKEQNDQPPSSTSSSPTALKVGQGF